MNDHRDDNFIDLEDEQQSLTLPQFTLEDAWLLGSTITQGALERGDAVSIDIRRTDRVLFRSCLPGSLPDQEFWIQRKAATALRFESSTLLLRERLAEMPLDALNGWLSPSQYVLAGGSIPIRVDRVGVVATATVSGLSDEEDHRMVADGIRLLKTSMLAQR